MVVEVRGEEIAAAVYQEPVAATVVAVAAVAVTDM
jgi:hypothetical protein